MSMSRCCISGVLCCPRPILSADTLRLRPQALLNWVVIGCRGATPLVSLVTACIICRRRSFDGLPLTASPTSAWSTLGYWHTHFSQVAPVHFIFSHVAHFFFFFLFKSWDDPFRAGSEIVDRLIFLFNDLMQFQQLFLLQSSSNIQITYQIISSAIQITVFRRRHLAIKASERSLKSDGVFFPGVPYACELFILFFLYK